ncbi:phage tail protein [Asticcacaulis sp. BYS171W]|uniref:Phage tail protein n=1 Tax=Asticcacaulis aquaticus TaxID=2984212 RepID=A0ABT5HT90_9CAUL|nr:phage tail protein [Asticcacaulis aquaticus]MDC7683265.1 phage tail protein [Asticcacaulis aquaticus]
MMMALDLFVFELASLPYQELAKRLEWRHAQAERFGARPASQFVGPGAHKVTLSGALYPGEVGSWSALSTIEAMADTGEAYLLISGTGVVLGEFFIRSLDTRESIFFVDGVARKADFTLELERSEL